MKIGRLASSILCLAASFIASSASAGSFTIDDSTDGLNTYWGGIVKFEGIDYASTSDIWGAASKYGVDSLTFSATSNNITIVLTGSFFGFTISPENTANILPGDVFLGNNGWSPTGTDAHHNTDIAVDDDWQYAITMDSNTGSSGTISLFSVDPAGSILYPEDYLSSLPSYEYRSQQEYQYVKATDQPVLGTGTWEISGNTLTYSLDIYNETTLADLLHNDGQVAIHWAQTCGNDVVEGIGTVPEPATMILFGSGLMGLVGLSRRKKK
ncbi:MAG: PEP-CTERM sorting domain-containing protein [Pseudomonadota bacterium]